MKKVLILSFFFFSYFATAADSSEDLCIEGCMVPNTIVVDKHRMDLLGAGVRVKQRGIWPICMDFNVYVAAFYASNKESFSTSTLKRKALDSLLSMPSFAITLQLLLEVDTETMVNGFQEALNANQVPNSNAITELMALLKRREKLIIGDWVSIVFVNDDFDKSIIVQQSDQNTVKIKANQTDLINIMSIWLGTPADEKLGELRTKLITGNI